MTSQEQYEISKLQDKASRLWAQLTALAALTRKIEADTEHPFNEVHPWGDAIMAAATMAGALVDSAEDLAAKLDYVAIQQEARKMAEVAA